jgi:hypothetical protein
LITVSRTGSPLAELLAVQPGAYIELARSHAVGVELVSP